MVTVCYNVLMDRAHCSTRKIYKGLKMSSSTETLILSGLLHVPDYQIKVLPYIKNDVFESADASTIFKMSKDFFDQYNRIPTKEALEIELEKANGLPELTYKESQKLIDKLFSDSVQSGIKRQNIDWMINTTEKYVVNRACELAVLDAYSIVSGENKKQTLESIPDMLKEAVSISFDTDIGHDYMEDFEKRYDFYHDVQSRIPFGLTMLNHITKGGVPRKSLIVPVAPTGVGKSLFLTDWTSYLLTEGYNVLYVTLEMAEERIAERMDAKLMNLNIEELSTISKEVFSTKINKLKSKRLGKIIVKEYPTGTFNANHLRHLLQELAVKKKFKPDVIMVDYLNLVASYRIPMGSSSYAYVKAVAEELRSVAMQFNCVVCAPTQTNRNGQNASDFELNEVSDSHGVSMTADLMFGFISLPELEQLGHMKIKQLKNRYGNLFAPNTFLVGVERPKMTLFDVDTVQKMVMNNIVSTPSSKPEESVEIHDDEELSFGKKPVKKQKLQFGVDDDE